LQFDEGTDRFHTGVGPITWGSNTWQGVGDLGRIERVQEGVELSPFALRMALSGIDATILDRAQNSDVYGRAVIVYLGFVDAAGDLVADPETIWSGTMDHPEIALGEGNEVMLTSESDLKRFETPNGSLFTDEDQQARYPGDLGFQYMQQLEDAKIVWRGEERVRFGRNPGRPPTRGRGTRGVLD